MQQPEISWTCTPWKALSLPAFYPVLRLRQVVFVVEQNCPFVDTDNLDQDAYHLIGLIENETALFTRIFPPHILRPECVISRVVVSPDFRGRGLGYTLMEKSHAQAQELWNAQTFFLSAQSHLRTFYENLGYVKVGPEYLEDDIPHIPMQRGTEAQV